MTVTSWTQAEWVRGDRGLSSVQTWTLCWHFMMSVENSKFCKLSFFFLGNYCIYPFWVSSQTEIKNGANLGKWFILCTSTWLTDTLEVRHACKSWWIGAINLKVVSLTFPVFLATDLTCMPFSSSFYLWSSNFCKERSVTFRCVSKRWHLWPHQACIKMLF